MNKLPKLSATKIQTYMTCPTWYKYRYIQGVSDRPNVYGLFGSAMHKAIEQWYSDGKDPHITLQEKMSDIHWDTQFIEQASRLTAQGHSMLDTLDLAEHIPVDLEKYFNLPYPNAENAICTIQGYIDVATDKYIVDWKTGKEKPTKLNDNIQFIIYYWAFEQLYGKAPDYVVYHRLRDHTKYKLTNPNMALLDAQIKTIINDPMEYPIEPCSSCVMYCGVKNAVSQIST